MPLQHWARELGLGHETGIDLPEEGPGLVPAPKWRDRLFEKFERCKNRTNPTRPRSPGQVRLADRPWSLGDNVNLAVGQGDLAGRPAPDGGRLRARSPTAARCCARGSASGSRTPPARPMQELEAPTRAASSTSRPRTAQAILDGLRGAASAPGGTSTPVFEGFPIAVAGKTGTAEKGAGRADQSWYVALAPWPDPKYVVAVTDEAGGFGAETAAPMARRILAELFDVNEQQLVAGRRPLRLMASSATRPSRTSASTAPAPAAARPAAAARDARADRREPLHGATRPPSATSPGDPHYYVTRQVDLHRASGWC